MAWSLKDLENLRAKGLGIDGVVSKGPEKKAERAVLPKPEAKGLVFMKNYLRLLKVDFVTEHIFHPSRLWRFDIAVPDMMLSVEYEGIFSEKSRHTGVNGYIGDIEKYNEAQKLGWTVLRYTAKNYEDFVNDFEFIKNGHL